MAAVARLLPCTNLQMYDGLQSYMLTEYASATNREQTEGYVDFIYLSGGAWMILRRVFVRQVTGG